MNPDDCKYVLEADVFIQAYRSYYAFDICSGFWEALLALHANSVILSIDKIKEDIERGRDGDPLKIWVGANVPASFWTPANSPDVAGEYARLAEWVMAEPQFELGARADIIRSADGWLVAFAKAKG